MSNNPLYLPEALKYFSNARKVYKPTFDPSFQFSATKVEDINPMGGVERPLNMMHALLRRAGHHYGELLHNPDPSAPKNTEPFYLQLDACEDAENVTLYFRKKDGDIKQVTLPNNYLKLEGMENLKLAQALLMSGAASGKLNGTPQGNIIREELGLDTRLTSKIIALNVELKWALKDAGIENNEILSLMSNLDIDKDVFERAALDFENALGVLVQVAPLMRKLQRGFRGIGTLSDEQANGVPVTRIAEREGVHYSNATYCQDAQMVGALVYLLEESLGVEHSAAIQEQSAYNPNSARDFLKLPLVEAAIANLKTVYEHNPTIDLHDDIGAVFDIFDRTFMEKTHQLTRQRSIAEMMR